MIASRPFAGNESPKMSIAYNTIATRFMQGRSNQTGMHMRSRGHRLYSYGMCIAVHRGLEEALCLLNTDQASSSTSMHQGLIRQACPQDAHLSFSAVRAAGLNIETCDVLDWTTGSRQSSYPATLLRDHATGVCYLAGLDEGQGFVSQLPESVGTIADAYQALMPSPVLKATRAGKTTPRQGEWFFVPVGPVREHRTRVRQCQKDFQLPYRPDAAYRHVCTRGMTQAAHHYVMGCVRHRMVNRTTGALFRIGQHRQLRLDPTMLYEALMNRSVANWSASTDSD
jgi:hypothetical protein